MTTVNPIPDGYTAVTPYLIVENAAEMLDFLAAAFGAVERLRVPMPGGGIGHAEVEINGAVMMLSDSIPEYPATNTLIHLYVTDVDAVYARAIEAGATSDAAPEDQFYGDRIGRITDPSGNRWTIATHVKDIDPDEIRQHISTMPDP